MDKQLILGSNSPRRKELLELAGFSFSNRKNSFDESTITETLPEVLVKELARQKGMAMDVQENEVLLTADTVVSANNTVLGKPSTEEEAFAMLAMLSGGTHQVYTAVMLRDIERHEVFVSRTEVEFWPLSEPEIHAYVATGDSFDKAGAYGIQSKGALLVKGIKGDYYTVMGLPLSMTVRELAKFQIAPTLL
ncbi:Maf family protein [Thalassobacillus hwangdonensis]|uniref:dTTP/UTP pyrophosphatase n=1 Tax=Thalassobacillus hwangdonensis TaxID=546108 RepID=A0ABW3L2V2_9BACI